MNASDLTTAEQTHVRTALRFLRTRCGGWKQAAKVLRFDASTLRQIAGGGTVSPTVALRVARLGRVTVDDVLGGRFPAPGTCPHRGHYEAPPSPAVMST